MQWHGLNVMSDIRHILEAQQFDPPLQKSLFAVADALRQGERKENLHGMIIASLFYEPSTRTRFSFESAMLRLGGGVLTTENARQFSSFSKGESLEDTIRIICGYADAIVLRHNEIGAARKAAQVATRPIINGGDGAGQHPTQALLDMYTLYRYFGEVDQLRIAMVGDLRYGRTVRSLAYLLGKHPKVKLVFVAPPVCRMLEDIKQYLGRCGVAWQESSKLEEVLPEVDCVYMTRIQKERFVDVQDFEQAQNRFRLDAQTMALMDPRSIVLHPLPRLDEIDPSVDSDPRAYYFRQAENGLWLRMAVLLLALGRL